MKFSTENFDIEVKGSWGYFEHKRLGDECAGSLRFVGRTLVDYSGVSSIPREVCEELQSRGAILRHEAIDPVWVSI